MLQTCASLPFADDEGEAITPNALYLHLLDTQLYKLRRYSDGEGSEGNEHMKTVSLRGGFKLKLMSDITHGKGVRLYDGQRKLYYIPDLTHKYRILMGRNWEQSRKTLVRAILRLQGR